MQREFFDVYWNDIVLGQAALMDHLPPVLKRIAPHLSADQFLAYWFEQDSRLNHALLENLDKVRTMGIFIYLATNQEHIRATYLMQSLRLTECVDDIYYSAQLGCKKPHPQFFHAISSASGFTPSELLLVDDTLANVAAAAALGWNTLHWSQSNAPVDIFHALKGT